MPRLFPGGNDLTLVGIALGAYGLTQAMFQIPFGMASPMQLRPQKGDRRRPADLFAFGSAVAALSTDIWWTIVGRVLQGAGRDLGRGHRAGGRPHARTAPYQGDGHDRLVDRPRSSPFSLVAAPALYAAIGMDGLFWMTAILALAAIGLVTHVVPPAPPPPEGRKPAVSRRAARYPACCG
jgi:hypothetical protein